jgi:magnesium transporter
MFISFRSFNHDFHSPDYLEAVSFYIVIFKEGVLTVSIRLSFLYIVFKSRFFFYYLQFRFQDLPHPHNVRRRIHQLKDFIRVTPEWINYALIDDITDSFAPLIQHTELEVDSIDDLVLVLNGSEQNDMLRRIGSCRKTVMQLLRLLGPKADVLRGLIKRYEDSNNNIRLRESHSTAPTDSVQEQDGVKVHHEVTLYLGDIQGKKKKKCSNHFF